MEINKTIAQSIDDYHSNQPEPLRPHLGASLAGHYCERYIWLSFRWAIKPKFSGRIKRLYRRGRNEEKTVVSDLLSVGFSVDTHINGKQFSINLAPHVSGSVDGIINRGITENQTDKYLLEIKTHGDKSFKTLLKNGVQSDKPQHYAQMQIYMIALKLTRALYYAINKNDDTIYTEIIEYNDNLAVSLRDRAARIALTERLPAPISTNPSWYQCKMCDMYDFCHKTKMTDSVNCRTCAHSTPCDDGQWRCARYKSKKPIPVEFQRTGCASHVIHPDLVPWPMSPTSEGLDAQYIIDGTPVRNGEPDAHVFGSSEIIANPQACVAAINGDTVINDLRNDLNAEIAS